MVGPWPLVEADSVLNHILKNTMADAAGEIDIFLSQAPDHDPHLVSSAECLRRGRASAAPVPPPLIPFWGANPSGSSKHPAASCACDLVGL